MLAPYESRSYVDLTIESMRRFGVKVAQRARKDGSVLYRVAAPQRYTAADMAIEGDYSQAAFLAVLGVLAGGITVPGWSLQAARGTGLSGYSQALRRQIYGRGKAGVRFSRSLLCATEI